MAWYSTLFRDIYGSGVGSKILQTLEQNIDRDLKGVFRVYLAIMELERVTLSTDEYDDQKLVLTINKVLYLLQQSGLDLTEPDKEVLNNIFQRNGLNLRI